jgi:hypothetical protein
MERLRACKVHKRCLDLGTFLHSPPPFSVKGRCNIDEWWVSLESQHNLQSPYWRIISLEDPTWGKLRNNIIISIQTENFFRFPLTSNTVECQQVVQMYFVINYTHFNNYIFLCPQNLLQVHIKALIFKRREELLNDFSERHFIAES